MLMTMELGDEIAVTPELEARWTLQRWIGDAGRDAGPIASLRSVRARACGAERDRVASET